MHSQVKEKLDFISLRQAKKLAKTTDYPMYLGIIRGTDDWSVPAQKLKTKKSKSKLGVAHGMTEGEKRRLMKETGPVTKQIPAEVVMQEHIQKADPEVRASLRGILEDYHDIFPSKLPYGPPPKRQLDHEIDTIPGEAPPHKSPYRLRSTEMEELRRQVELLLEQGWIRPSSSPYSTPVLFVPVGNGFAAFTNLKLAMVTSPVLQLPDFDREFAVTTDASEVSVGAILQQDFGRGLQPLCYDSRKLNPAECRYSAYEQDPSSQNAPTATERQRNGFSTGTR